MTRLLILGLALLPTLPAQISKTAATLTPVNPAHAPPGMKIARGTFTGLERRFDGMLAALGTPNEPIDPLGATRGVYLDGYGAVITAELGLVLAPNINPFRPTITPELIAQVHQRKTERMPALSAAMREMVRIAGLTLIQVPQDQQIILVVRLDYFSWENTSKLPSQIIMRADRKAAMVGEVKEDVQ